MEFRGSEWQRNSVYRGLSDVRTAFVNVDEPRLPKLPEPTEVVSSELAYLRFHGRNAANWWKGDNVSRYDYLYSEGELREWIAKIKDMSQKARKTFVFFNNCHAGQAASNARLMKELLSLPL